MERKPAYARQGGSGVSGKTLVVVGVVVAVLVVAGAAVFLVMKRSTDSSARQVLCMNNLKQMYMGMHVFRASHGKKKFYPPHAGEKFLRCLTGCTDAEHPADMGKEAVLDKDVLKCPSASTPPGSVDYRGPKRYEKLKPDVASALDDSVPAERVIGCDKPGNHANGENAVRFDGSVREMEGAAFEEALQTTE